MSRAREQANLSSDSNIFVDIANDRTGIGVTTPSQKLEIAGNIKLGDNQEILIGTGSDLKLWHDGTHSYIRTSSGTQNLNLQTTNGQVILGEDGGHIGLYYQAGGTVELRYDNSKKIETTSSGATVTGDITISDKIIHAGDTNTAIRFPSDDTVTVETGGTERLRITSGGNVHIPGDSKHLYVGAGQELSMMHDGTHSWVEDIVSGGNLVLRTKAGGLMSAIVLQAGQENSLICNKDGSVELYYDAVKKVETTSAGAKVTGNLEVTGVLTYDDVTNIDSVGIVTARAGVKIPDSQGLTLGTDNDIVIKHQSGHFQITNNTGNTYFDANGQLLLRNNQGGSNKELLVGWVGVDLKYDNSTKLSTTSTGINVTGVTVDDGATHDGDVTFTGASSNILWDKSANTLLLQDSAFLNIGTGNDLQLYHNPSNNHSYISEQGSGSLIILADDLYIQDTSTNSMIQCIEGAQVQLHYAGNKKFETTNTGATLTGNLTLDGAIYLPQEIAHYGDTDTNITFPAADTIAFDTGGSERLRIASDGHIAIGGYGDPSTILDIRENQDGAETQIRLYNTDNGDTTTQTAAFYMSPDSRGAAYTGLRAIKENASFATNAGRDIALSLNVTQNNSQVQALRITSDGNLRQLWGDGKFLGTYYDSTYYMGFTYGATARTLYIDNRSNDTRADIVFRTGESTAAAERLRITSAGYVGVGEASPATILHVKANTGDMLRLDRNNTGAVGNQIAFRHSASGTLTETGSINCVSTANAATGDLVFYTKVSGGSNTEKLRITSAGLIQAKTRTAEVRRMILAGSPSNWAFNIEAHDGETGTSSGDVQGKLGLFYNDGTTLTNTACISFERGSGAPDGAMAFVTNQSEKFRIKSDGYAEFAGASDLRLTLGSQGTAGTNDANWLRASGTNLMYNAASGSHKWEIGGAQKLELTSGGDVVIGNFTPVDTRNTGGVHIQATKGVSFKAHSSSSSRNWRIRNDDFAWGNLDFSVGTSNSDFADADDEMLLSLTSSRRVGIRNTTPQEMLHVGDGSGTEGGLKVAGQSSSVTDDGLTIDWTASNEARLFSESSGNATMHFYTTSSGTRGERLRIDSNGNIIFGVQTGSSAGINNAHIKWLNCGSDYWSGTAGDYRAIRFGTYYMGIDDIYGVGISNSLLEIQSQADIGWFAGTAGSGTGRRNLRMKLEGANGRLQIQNGGRIEILSDSNSGYDGALLKMGYVSGASETRAIDIGGGWSANESKSISFIHGSSATQMVGQINCMYNGSGSHLRWGKLYHGGDSSTYTMDLVSSSTTTATLKVTDQIIVGDPSDTQDYSYATATFRHKSARSATGGSAGYPNWMPLEDTRTQHALVQITAGGNGGTSTAGYGPVATMVFGEYYDSAALIIAKGGGSGGPSMQGTGHGKDMMISGGNSDNTNGKHGGRLFLQSGSGYQGSAWHKNHGETWINQFGGDVHVGGCNNEEQKFVIHAYPNLHSSTATAVNEQSGEQWEAKYVSQRGMSNSNDQAWYKYEFHGGYASRAHSLDLWVTWTTGHAAPSGCGRWHIGVWEPHGGHFGINCKRQYFMDFNSGGTYYSWGVNPSVYLYRGTTPNASGTHTDQNYNRLYFAVRGRVGANPNYGGALRHLISCTVHENNYRGNPAQPGSGVTRVQNKFEYVGETNPSDLGTYYDWDNLP